MWIFVLFWTYMSILHNYMVHNPQECKCQHILTPIISITISSFTSILFLSWDPHSENQKPLKTAGVGVPFSRNPHQKTRKNNLSSLPPNMNNLKYTLENPGEVLELLFCWVAISEVFSVGVSSNQHFF